VGILRLSAVAVVCLSVVTTGCVQTEFQEQKAQNIIAAVPIHLDAEWVTLSFPQVECGAQNDLWEQPGQARQEHAAARLLAAGKELHFDDDVVVAEPGYSQPYVQIRGDFRLQLAAGPSIRDDGADGRIVEGKLGLSSPIPASPMLCP